MPKRQVVEPAVASGHEAVTRIACEILRAGGNAFDAAVAAGLASAVAEPGLTSLGGGGFLLARTSERAILFDFFADTPGRGLASESLEPHFLPVTVRFAGSDQIFNVGLGSVAVPGNLRGYLHVHRRLGRMPLGDVTRPAIDLARDGVLVTRLQAYVLSLLRPILTLTDEGRALFEGGGRYPIEGDRFRNPKLGAFLDALDQGADRDFYEGETARRIARAMQAGGGLLTAEDLARYEVTERMPLSVGYRGRTLLTNPPPSFGGTLLGLSLRLMERTGNPPSAFGAVEHVVKVSEVMKEVDAFRQNGPVGDLRPTDEELDEGARRVRTASGGTTHISILDAEGNVASMTTSNGEGSGFVAPETGIMLNNMMGEDDLHPDGFHSSPPGMRVSSMMCPSLLLGPTGDMTVLGSGGSKRIRTALLQVVLNVVDLSMDLEKAVRAPRMHWDGEVLQLEPGFGPEAVRALEARSPVNLWRELEIYFGGVHAVDSTGGSAGDPRRGGSAQAV